MATATQTSTAMSRPAKDGIGLISKTISFNSGTVSCSGASVIELCKIPFGATIIEVNGYTSTGAASAPIDVGGLTNASDFVSQATQGAVWRATKGLPYRVTGSDDAVNKYLTLKGTITPGTSTASVKIDVTVVYTMDE